LREIEERLAGIVMIGNEMIWDLSQLVENTNPISVQEQLNLMIVEAGKFSEKYHGKIGGLDAKGLLELLELRDERYLRFEGVVQHCILMYAADSTDEVAKKLSDSARKAMMKADQALAFVEIELGRLLRDKPSLIKDPVLIRYRHYLEKVLRKIPHMLSETEERLTIVKDKNGVRAWELLQKDWLSTRTFDIEIEGAKKTLSYGQMVGLYQSSDRDLRKRANQTVYEVLGKDEIVWAGALRSVCEDHLEMCGLRKWDSPMMQSLIDNDVDQRAIDSLRRTIEKNVSLYRRYLKLKAQLMGLSVLANYDIVAPLPKMPEADYSWIDSREEVVGAYSNFDDEVGGWIVEMFDRRHIDGEVRKGKESGAFCAPWIAGKSAYILQSFNMRRGDVYTQAHELGHAVHDYLMSRTQQPTNCDVGSCVAETGSTFGELLLTERLLSKTKLRDEKKTILSFVLDEFGMGAFQVSARVIFEESLYEAIKKGQFLDGETIAKLWTDARDHIYGDAVEWLDVMRWEWTMKPHYYMANYRFYNYPYVYAQLFVFALYKLYKEQGKAFVPKLKALLAAGSSKSPRELANELGFDISEESFWEKGMQQAAEFIQMLEETL
jgi:oligoendopeptidase F